MPSHTYEMASKIVGKILNQFSFGTFWALLFYIIQLYLRFMGKEDK